MDQLGPGGRKRLRTGRRWTRSSIHRLYACRFAEAYVDGVHYAYVCEGCQERLQRTRDCGPHYLRCPEADRRLDRSNDQSDASEASSIGTEVRTFAGVPASGA